MGSIWLAGKLRSAVSRVSVIQKGAVLCAMVVSRGAMEMRRIDGRRDRSNLNSESACQRAFRSSLKCRSWKKMRNFWATEAARARHCQSAYGSIKGGAWQMATAGFGLNHLALGSFCPFSLRG